MQNGRVVVLIFATLLAAAVAGQGGPQSWVDSPEAFFLTPEEMDEWFDLRTNDEREAFQARYWARRDPSPATPRNEFREMVEGRIAVADERFTLDVMRGALTERGRVFIVFGTPANVRDAIAGRGNNTTPSANSEWSRVQSVWTYDRIRTPKLLEMIERPRLQIEFLIEPAQKKDMLHDPSVVKYYRDMIARKSVVNEVPAAGVPAFTTPTFALESLPGPGLSPAVTRQLDDAAARPDGAHAAATWLPDGTAVALFWLTVPEDRAPGSLTLHGRIRSGDTVLATISRPIDPVAGFTTSGAREVVAVQVPLSGGTYDATLLVTGKDGAAVSSGSARLVVPAQNAPFTMSSLVLTDGSSAPDGAGLLMGTAVVRPRADATFRTNESLWYVFQVANAPDTAMKLKLMVRNQRTGKVQTAVMDAGLSEAGRGRHVGGFELPLESMAPGPYSLYVTLRDPAGVEQVRRADFDVIAP